MPFHKGHADSSFSTLSAHAQPSLSGIDSFILLGLSFCRLSETTVAATKILKQLCCSWMKIKIQFLFWKTRFFWNFSSAMKPREEFFSSPYRTCHWKNFSVFLRVTAGMLTLGKVPATSSVFPTMLSKLAQSRIIQCCVSKRNSSSEPSLFWYPCAAAVSGTASDDKKVFQLENK